MLATFRCFHHKYALAWFLPPQSLVKAPDFWAGTGKCSGIDSRTLVASAMSTASWVMHYPHVGQGPSHAQPGVLATLGGYPPLGWVTGRLLCLVDRASTYFFFKFLSQTLITRMQPGKRAMTSLSSPRHDSGCDQV